MPENFLKKLVRLLTPKEITRFFQDKFYPQDKSRIQKIRDRITGIERPEMLMQLIIRELDKVEYVPDPGKYYTFAYTAKTPNIIYDQHPLVLVAAVRSWGFLGMNYHWNEFRNYTWEELQTPLYVVYPNELDDLRALPYAMYKRSR